MTTLKRCARAVQEAHVNGSRYDLTDHYAEAIAQAVLDVLTPTEDAEAVAREIEGPILGRGHYRGSDTTAIAQAITTAIALERERIENLRTAIDYALEESEDGLAWLRDWRDGLTDDPVISRAGTEDGDG